MLKSRHQIGLETNGLDLGPGLEGFISVPISVSPGLEVRNSVATSTRAPIYKISYDLSEDYRKFIVGSTHDSDLQSAKPGISQVSLRTLP